MITNLETIQRQDNINQIYKDSADIAGAAVLLEIGAQYGVIDFLRSSEIIDVSDVVKNTGIPTNILLRYLKALVSAGLIKPLEPGSESGKFRAMSFFDQMIHTVGYVCWGLGACQPLISHAREFANSPLASCQNYKRDGGLVARTSAWMGEKAFYPQAERAIISLRPKRIVDLGAGSAQLLIQCLKLLPDAIGIAVDVSAKACAQARSAAEQAGVTDRLEVVESPIQVLADDDSILQGADVIHAGFVLHDLLPEEEASLDAILFACHKAAPTGTLLFMEAIPYAERNEERMFSAAFSFLHECFMGRTLLSEAAWRKKLLQAGFKHIKCEPLGIPGGRLFSATSL
ncbi:MAG: methyltransferase domain-containing protein [Tolypothrix carrinoi HA7290-LM1]|jgi:SAM-dependent methyltransferase|nr:methyltransferase domain-containing protein [Tolypothrix carrinoi HA7290-LM1]